MELEHGYAEVNNVTLHYVTAGKGKLMMFLHGFPEFWYDGGSSLLSSASIIRLWLLTCAAIICHLSLLRLSSIG